MKCEAREAASGLRHNGDVVATDGERVAARVEDS